jgi:acetyl esterase/lipase
MADGLQALRYVRANAAKYNIDPNKVGFMGFSAGAMTTMRVVLNGAAGERPNLAAPIYGALQPGKSPPADGPPLFIAAAQDDPQVPVRKSAEIFSAWKGAGLPAELHIYESGGHGFGMLTRNKASDSWPVAFETWLRGHGWITASPTAISATPVASAAPAKSAVASGPYSTATTSIGTLLDDPAAKAILVRRIPELATSPQIEQARGMTLKEAQQYAPDKVSDQTLANIDAELARLPPKK